MSCWIIFSITHLNWEFLLKWYNFFWNFCWNRDFLLCTTISIDFNCQLSFPFMSRSRKFRKGRIWIFYLRLRNSQCNRNCYLFTTVKAAHLSHHCEVTKHTFSGTETIRKCFDRWNEALNEVDIVHLCTPEWSAHLRENKSLPMWPQCGNETGAPGTSLFTFCFSFQPKFWSLARFLHQEHRGNTLKQFNTSTRQRRYNAPWRKFLLHHFWTKQWASFYFSLYVQATDTFCRCCKRFYSTKGHRPSPPAQDSGVDELWNNLNLCLVILH